MLAAALREGVPLATRWPAPGEAVLPAPEGPWPVRNPGGASYPPLDLSGALVRSVNTSPTAAESGC